MPELFAFNGATKQLGIGRDQHRFWEWRRFLGAEVGELHTLDGWRWFYDRFIEFEDAQSERDTLLDALT